MVDFNEDVVKKRRPTVKPTADNPYIKPRHRAIFERMKGGETITGAMIAMSYKPKTVNRPSVITKSKSWQALMDEQLPDDIVAKRHREILDKRDRSRVKNEETGKYEYIDNGPDAMVVKGVELAYKLRGRAMGDAPPAAPTNVYNLFYQQNVQASVKAFESTLKETIAYEVDRQNPSETGIDTGDASGSDAGTVEEASADEGAVK